ncbi:hypothetical protein KPH14_010487 [Odynerus spinipes]|uniref:tRNA:m(4)X modification enzyme TRM13 n=1 Tax=Odynerus spinipes TaxID=1348599 RepID=A0AAD9RU12_9HYME|nr:hypothetical protein KPH14_010487 [Odynerus spinipes]
MTVKKGNKFCGEHQQDSLNSNNVEDMDTSNKRIKCPLDPTHTCYRSKLSKHLTICNARKMLDALPTYIVKNINLDKETEEIPRMTPLSQLDFSIVDIVIKKINEAYEKLPKISEAILQHDVLKDTLDVSFCGKRAKKHLTQNSSLLAHLEKAGLVQDNTCYVEFGAGKGNLTYWLAQMTKEKANSCILLVDRSSHRHKNDNKLKKEEHNIYIKRVRADIADLQLNNIPEIKNSLNKVGVAKHLCGTATDLSIRCLMQVIDNRASGSNYGLIIAFCCHHKCEYKSYVGKKYLEQCGFVPNEFPILCSIASWATCGFNLKNTNKLEEDDGSNKRANEQDIRSSERELIGYKVKALLNWGRLKYLKNYGFEASLVHYISTDVSLENICIRDTFDLAKLNSRTNCCTFDISIS